MEEATQPKVCRCLLRDMTGENDYLRSVERYRATMPRRLRTPTRCTRRGLPAAGTARRCKTAPACSAAAMWRCAPPAATCTVR